MPNLSSLTRRVSEYARVLEQTIAYRKMWADELEAAIRTSLEALVQEVGLQAKVETREEIANLAAITLSLGNVSSGMSQEVVDGVSREMIKHNGSLIYQQLFNGKVIVVIQYPFIESHGEQQPARTIGIFRPEELRPPYFQRHLEELLAEVTKWEDFDDDEPHQKIGFKLNFEQPELSTTAGSRPEK